MTSRVSLAGCATGLLAEGTFLPGIGSTDGDSPQMQRGEALPVAVGLAPAGYEYPKSKTPTKPPGFIGVNRALYGPDYTIKKQSERLIYPDCFLLNYFLMNLF